MSPGSARRTDQSPVEASAASATAAMLAAADSLHARLELVLDERLGPLSADQRGFLEVARKDGRRLLKLIADFREIALADAGLLELEWGRVDLAELAEEAAASAADRAAAVGKAVTVAAAEPAAIPADAARVRNAAGRLVRHAVQHAAPGCDVELRATPGGLLVRYEAEAPPAADSLAIAFAAAMARAHGGSLALSWTDGTVAIDVGFVTADAPVVPIGVAA